ncbi:hypothetical protein ACE6H2_012080 [Prunus campanulata]
MDLLILCVNAFCHTTQASPMGTKEKDAQLFPPDHCKWDIRELLGFCVYRDFGPYSDNHSIPAKENDLL